MSLVVLIEKPDMLTDFVETDMRRWWGHSALKKCVNGEVYFCVSGKFKLYEGAKRLGSFGVKARVARRPEFPLERYRR